MNQREGVFNATISVIRDSGKTFEEGQDVKGIVTSEMRTSIIGIVVEGFKSGEIEMSAEAKAKYSDDAKLKSYTNGLVSNWHRKDTRLNGGSKYIIKNPGSRAGQGDAKLKALRALRAQFTGVDDDKTAEIDMHIEARVKELGAEKAKKVEIDLSVLDPELIESLGLSKE